jgi:ribonucleotide reductase alpha subunit
MNPEYYSTNKQLPIDYPIKYSNSLENMQNNTTSWQVIKRDGRSEPVQFDKVVNRIRKLSDGLTNINVMEIAQKVIANIHDGIKTTKIDQETSEICISKLSVHPDYGVLASRLCVSNIHKNTSPSFSEVTKMLYEYTDVNGKPYPLVNQKYYDFVMNNAKKINSVIDYTKDYNFDYFGFKTLERAYLWKINDIIVERPQHMIMRVSLAIHKEDMKEAIKCYRGMADGYFIHATPTLFNMGSPREQASSCFLIDIDDDSIVGIYKTLSDCAKISKYAGGIGISIHKIRSKGSKIRGTNGKTDGLARMLKVFNETACYVNQAGKRKGSFAIYIEPWHKDIIDVLMLRKNTGAESERARDLFYALWVPDLFMERVEKDEKWTLMCPDECPGLQDVYGEDFVKLYTKYETEGKGEIIEARKLWNIITEIQTETGVPYIGYKDAVNRKSNQKNLGIIRGSNLCIEIVEYTSKDEIAVCNLASLALPKFIKKTTEKDGSITKTYDFKLLREHTKQVCRNLNNIINVTFYPVPEAERSNRRHRPIGIGIQGLADTFFEMKYPFGSKESIKLNKDIAENMYFAALEASMELARKRKKYVQEYKRLHNFKVKNPNHIYTDSDNKVMQELKETYNIIDEELKLPGKWAGAYSSYVDSPISEGKLQYDLWNIEPSEEMKEEWEILKSSIEKHGVYNSLLLAFMPTASTSQILGNFESFEVPTNNIFVRETLAGVFLVINKHLVNDLINEGIWNNDLREELILHNGSIQTIDRIPTWIKDLYKNMWETSQQIMIDLAADRGPFIDQTQSMNVYMENATHKKLSSMHFYAWKKGLKTGMYYLRTKAKTKAQQFSIDIEKIVKMQENKQSEKPTEEEILACSLANPGACDMCSG